VQNILNDLNINAVGEEDKNKPQEEKKVAGSQVAGIPAKPQVQSKASASAKSTYVRPNAQSPPADT
jgi:hypothetical protein